MDATREKVARLGSILSLWAHPDDETLCAAGVMALAAQNGQKVTCITATRGELGVQNIKKWPAAQLGDIRKQEMRAALRIIGVQEHHFLDFADCSCGDTDSDKAVESIKELVGVSQFDSIITFGPEGLTGHPDHQAVSRWAVLLAKELKIKQVYQATITPRQYQNYLRAIDDQIDLFFNIDQPPLTPPGECDLLLSLPPATARLKCQALKAMPSQTEKLMTSYDIEFLCAAFAEEAFILAKVK